MHRSGTSVVSRLLNLMGIYFGPEGSSTGANQENIKGFWERKDVRKLNDYILQENNFDWYKIADFDLNKLTKESVKHFDEEASKLILDIDGNRPWFVKEPRFCLNFPLWKKHLEVPICIYVYRNPIEVAKSLRKRNGFPIKFGVDLWEKYNYLAIKAMKGLPMITINFNELISEPQKVTKKMFADLSTLGVTPLREISGKELKAFISKKLYRERGGGQEILTTKQNQLYVDITERNFPEIVNNYELSDTSETELKEVEDFFNHVNSLSKYGNLNELHDKLKISENLVHDLDESDRQNQELVKKLAESDRQKQVLVQKSDNQKEEFVKKLKKTELLIDKAKSENSKLMIAYQEVQLELIRLNSGKENSSLQLQINDLKWEERLRNEHGKIVELETEISKNNKKVSLIKSELDEQRRIIENKDEIINRSLAKWIKRKIDAHKNRKTLKRNLRSLKRKRKIIVNDHKASFPIPTLQESPLVSIIILNKDGLIHLKQLFRTLVRNTSYSNYEIIVVDNNSQDNSISFLEGLKLSNLRIIKSRFNDSFSRANNAAAAKSKGELLVFLNNDVKPFYGWLTHMVHTYFSAKPENVGVVGSKLLYPVKVGEESTLRFQHTGIAFRNSEQGFVRPINIDNGRGFDEITINSDTERVAVTAACLLISKERFYEIDCFDTNYIYGYEDVDLCLKAFKKGYKNYLSAGSALFHHEFGSQRKDSLVEISTRRMGNKNFFRDSWYRYLMNNYWREVLDPTDTRLFANKKLTIGFVVTEEGKDSTAGDFFTAYELAIQFRVLGYEIKYITKKSEKWYDIESDVDILIVMLHSYDISKIQTENKALIKVAWIRNWFDKFSDLKSFSDFNIVLSSSKKACKYLSEKTGKLVHYFPIATNEKRFSKTNLFENELQCDYCFTGSYWNDKREIIEMIQPSQLPEYKFHLYGENWGKVDKLRTYHKGFVNYDDIPAVYANTKILIDDANRVTKPWGSVNSRVFDALVSNVLVITNSELSSKDALFTIQAKT